MAEHLCEYRYPKDCPVCSLIDPMAIDVTEQLREDCEAMGIPVRDDLLGKLAARRAESYRIEALRAASRIVAGMYAGSLAPTVDDSPARPGEGTMVMADEFARWLEMGER